MKKAELWKNFSLGMELGVAGSFIYDGLKDFDQMKDYNNPEEVFSYLYKIAVGIERLQKICIILTEHNENDDQEKFQASLLTHNHNSLMNRIRECHSINFDKIHNAFINLLCEFYKKHRYFRFEEKNTGTIDMERILFIQYLQKHYKQVKVTSNCDGIKKFIGNVIGKICNELYEIITKESNRLNIYSYEVRYNSKAYKVFMKKEYNFLNEKLAWRELLVFLLNNTENSGFLDFVRDIEPVDLEIPLIPEYLKVFDHELAFQNFLDELASKYEDDFYNKKDLEDRKEKFNIFTNSHIPWAFEDDDIGD